MYIKKSSQLNIYRCFTNKHKKQRLNWYANSMKCWLVDMGPYTSPLVLILYYMIYIRKWWKSNGWLWSLISEYVNCKPYCKRNIPVNVCPLCPYIYIYIYSLFGKMIVKLPLVLWIFVFSLMLECRCDKAYPALLSSHTSSCLIKD